MTENDTTGQEVLVVVSKLKNFIRESSGMNTSGNVATVISDMVRTLCTRAIENAKKDGRKTVMDRDFSLSSSSSTSTSSTGLAA